MPEKKAFVHPSRGKGRPQILLIGNGLEQTSDQLSWKELVASLKVEGSPEIPKEVSETLPFPLLYELLSTPEDAPAQLSREDIAAEDKRLKKAMEKLKHHSNPYLDRLPALGADHVMTTNYTYCIDSAFFPGKNFSKPTARSKVRFQCGDGPKELNYRLHTGYLAGETGIWHIHGEVGNPQGIVLGHDRYGRLLGRIAEVCGRQRYSADQERLVMKRFESWPELFLYGDVYVLGFGFDPSEFDLWWLLRRKQRERYADGRVYYYDCPTENGFTKAKHYLLKANGALLLDAGAAPGCDYGPFYDLALRDIARRIAENREGK